MCNQPVGNPLPAKIRINREVGQVYFFLFADGDEIPDERFLEKRAGTNVVCADGFTEPGKRPRIGEAGALNLDNCPEIVLT